MNDMELLRELAQETPLPAPAELDAARARLAAAIAADPAASGAVTARSRAASPDPVAAAGRAAAASCSRAGADRGQAHVRGRRRHRRVPDHRAALHRRPQGLPPAVLGHRLTAAQVSHERPLIITLTIVAGLVVIALWLWLARAVGQGRNWARILSTVLLGLATLELLGNHGVAQVFCAGLTWLTGLAAVWLLWRPASRAFLSGRP